MFIIRVMFTSINFILFFIFFKLTALLLYMIEECKMIHEDSNINLAELSTFILTKLSVILKNCLKKNNCVHIFHNIYLKYINR
jgi:ABC-type Mn2+/Zn2+ transport system permease subunit